MATFQNNVIENLFYEDLKSAKGLVYDLCGLKLENLIIDNESKEYAACSFTLNGKLVQYRNSKITPTKVGQFVSIWKRNQAGITEPYSSSDHLDFIIISARDGAYFGQFIFPKSILTAKGIITYNGKEGKRGIRVYPPWDITNNPQAIKTQQWQNQYFLEICPNPSLEMARKLFGTL